MKLFSGPQLKHVLALLEANQLPTADVPELNLDHFLGCGDPNNPSGVIGLQMFSDAGLLRSLVVDESVRGEGCGEVLVRGIEEYARDKGVHNLYLLTETAPRFFESLGYVNINRASAPQSIIHSSEFSTLCSENAVLMKKEI